MDLAGWRIPPPLSLVAFLGLELSHPRNDNGNDETERGLMGE